MNKSEEALLRAFARKYSPSKVKMMSYEPGKLIRFALSDRYVTFVPDGKGGIRETKKKKKGVAEYEARPEGMRAKERDDFSTEGVLKEITRQLGISKQKEGHNGPDSMEDDTFTVKTVHGFPFQPGDSVRITSDAERKAYTVQEVRWYSSGIDYIIVNGKYERLTVCGGDLIKVKGGIR